jgi:hypothetical protein
MELVSYAHLSVRIKQLNPTEEFRRNLTFRHAHAHAKVPGHPHIPRTHADTRAHIQGNM